MQSDLDIEKGAREMSEKESKVAFDTMTISKPLKSNRRYYWFLSI